MRAVRILLAAFAVIFFFSVLQSRAQIEKDGGALLYQQQLNSFTEEEISILQSLWIGSLPRLPEDPSNAFFDNPRAVQFGKKLFSDVRFSANNKISCASCHKAEVTFTDNEPLAIGISTSTRRSMPIVGLAYFKWFFWDGRADSLWAQALEPFENPAEHGITRCRVVLLIIEHYRKEYEEVFGPLPAVTEKNCPRKATPVLDAPVSRKLWDGMTPGDREAVNRVFSNTGKAIAAFERLIVPTPSRFDQYVEALLQGDSKKMKALLGPDEIEGMRLFIGKGKCVECHSTPLFADDDFHIVKVPGRSGVPFDKGRAEGIEKVLADEFNCYGKYSDAEPKNCLALNTIEADTEKYIGAFKTPILRNVAERPPYMHAGQFKTIAKVLAFYQYPFDFHLEFDLGHATLTDKELEQIEAFLHTLSSPLSFP